MQSSWQRQQQQQQGLTTLQHDGIRLVVGHDAVHDGPEEPLVRLVIHAVLCYKTVLHIMLVTCADAACNAAFNPHKWLNAQLLEVVPALHMRSWSMLAASVA
jgi:hypothetical protein